VCVNTTVTQLETRNEEYKRKENWSDGFLFSGTKDKRATTNRYD